MILHVDLDYGVKIGAVLPVVAVVTVRVVIRF